MKQFDFMYLIMARASYRFASLRMATGVVGWVWDGISCIWKIGRSLGKRETQRENRTEQRTEKSSYLLTILDTILDLSHLHILIQI